MYKKGPNESIKIGPQGNDTYDRKVYEISFEVYDNLVYEGTSCRDYRILETSYGECMETVFKEKITEDYGCVPPWLETGKILDNDTIDNQCEVNNNSTNELDTDRFEQIYKDLDKLTDGLTVDWIQDSCLPPCIETKIKLIKKVDFTSNHYQGKMDISSNKKVTKFRAVIQIFKYIYLDLRIH